VNFTDELRAHLDLHGLKIQETKIPAISARSVKIATNPAFSAREEQLDGIKYLVHDPSPRRGLELQTGKGKTFTAITAMVQLGVATIIVVDQLVAQWQEALGKFLKLKPGDLYVMQGSKSIMELRDMQHQPKIFLASLPSLRPFYDGDEDYAIAGWTWEQFLVKYGIGLKIIDEAHLNFAATLQLDMHSNIRHNVYLSATFTKTNPQTRKIFNMIFPAAMRFGAAEYDRYVHACLYSYCIEANEAKMHTVKGYNHGRWEAFLLKRKTKFNEFVTQVLVPVLQSHFLNDRDPHEKVAIYVATIDMVTAVVHALRQLWPKLRINEFIAGTDDKVLDKSDIVVTTLKKAGVGTDMANLLAVCNTISMQSEPQFRQLFGRLRKLKEKTPRYIEVRNRLLQSHQRHYFNRRPYLLQMAKWITESRL
jgi:hypothetical protein